jgi:hypothetical protein
MIVGDFWGSIVAEIEIAVLVGMIGQRRPRVGHSQHRGLQVRVSKVLGHGEAVSRVPAIFSRSVHGYARQLCDFTKSAASDILFRQLPI